MSLLSDGVVQISLGETLMGSDDGRLINVKMEGREAVISHDDVLSVASVIGTGKTGIRSTVRVMRNMTGGTIYGGQSVKINPADGINGSARATAVGNAGKGKTFLVDPCLPSSGVADKDLFLAIIKGPALALAPAGGVALTAAGLPFVTDSTGKAAVATKSRAILLESLKVWDAMQSNIVGAGANDDLGLVTGTLGTDAPSVQSGDGKAATTNRYAAFTVQVPDDYVAGSPLSIVIKAGMKTTISDTSAVVDVQAYRVAAPTVDICETAQQSMNSLTAADKTFVLTPTDVVAGETLIVRVKVGIVDAATGTAVIGVLSSIKVVTTSTAVDGRLGVYLTGVQLAASNQNQLLPVVLD